MTKTTDVLEAPETKIAVIGMDGRFPGAKNTNELLELLKAGKETITHFSDEQLQPHEINPEKDLSASNYVKSRGVLEDVELFDENFFCYTPKDAAMMDPQHRIWLEVAHCALEASGYCRDDYSGTIGVFTGCTTNNYLLHNLLQTRRDIEEFVRFRRAKYFSQYVGNANTFLSTVSSYKLNLTGPSVNIQTGCSTSLVSIVMGINSLLNYECDICLAGGVSVCVPQHAGHFYREGAIGSNDGHCRPFDAEAKGTVFGSGAGALVLKRLDEALEDNDHILAVIRGGAINNDGGRKISYMAPSVEGQTEVISTALGLAEVSPEDISYIEAHGTATPIGDPIEILALAKVFEECKKNTCAISSIKGNIGHLDSAAGVAGAIKTILALSTKTLFPTVHFKKTNPLIEFEKTPFYVVDKLTSWESKKPRRAGVSSFGIGGTNAHLVLEEAPVMPSTDEGNKVQILLFCAKNNSSLKEYINKFDHYLEQNPEENLCDISYTLSNKRRHYNNRSFCVCENNIESAKAAVSILARKNSSADNLLKELISKKVVFMFPGQGALYQKLGKQLYETDSFYKDLFDKCCSLAQPLLQIDLKKALFSDKDSDYKSITSLNQHAQLVGFIVDYCMAMLLIQRDIKPDFLLGHSLGEWVGACVSGVLNLEQSIKAVFHRGRLMESVAGNGGALSVLATEEELKPYAKGDLSIACVNAPKICLLSGPKDQINEAQKELLNAQIKCTPIPISVAVHSNVLDSIIQPFEEILKEMTFNTPQIPIYSPAKGGLLLEEEAKDPSFWAAQMRKQVKYSQTITQLLKTDNLVLVEAGPGTTLKALSKRHITDNNKHHALSTLPTSAKEDEQICFLEALGNLWVLGIKKDFKQLYLNQQRRTVPVPTYAFLKKRHWIDPPVFSDSLKQTNSKKEYTTSYEVSFSASHTLKKEQESFIQADTVDEKLLQIWKDALGIDSLGDHDDFYDLGGESFQAVQLLEEVANQFEKSIPLSEFPSISNIFKMSQYLGLKKSVKAKSESLVPIKSGDLTKPILFLPHGVGGTVHWGYANIAQGIENSMAIYGFKVPKSKSFKTFEEMADFYIKEMKQLQPKGPYFLCGYCYGGNVAYQMATQLTQMGEEVGFLGMVEAWPINSNYGAIKLSPEYFYNFATNLPGLLLDFAQRPKGDQLRSIKSKVKLWSGCFKDKILHPLDKSSNCKGENKLKRAIRMVDMVDIERYSEGERQIWESLIQLQIEHIPKAAPVYVDVFRAQKQPLTSPLDYSLGWGELAQKGVYSHVVPGSHFSVVDKENGKELGRAILKRIMELKLI